MRFIVFGAGAIGGVIGGRLFEHGHDVVLIARGAHRDAISKGGLRLESPDSAVTLPIPVVGDPGEVRFGPDDVVLLAIKSQDTSAAIDALSSVAGRSLTVACVQNGVENERVALRRFTNVYGVCVMCPATHLVPGVVQSHSAPVKKLASWTSVAGPLESMRLLRPSLPRCGVRHLVRGPSSTSPDGSTPSCSPIWPTP